MSRQRLPTWGAINRNLQGFAASPIIKLAHKKRRKERVCIVVVQRVRGHCPLSTVDDRLESLEHEIGSVRDMVKALKEELNAKEDSKEEVIQVLCLDPVYHEE